MLSTDDIIQLYDDQDYFSIRDHLKIYISRAGTQKSIYVLQYAIDTNNIKLFTHTLTADNLCEMVILQLESHPLLYPQLELILSTNQNLCDSFGNLINSMREMYYIGLKIMKIFTLYVTNINREILEKIFNRGVDLNDIDTIKSILISTPDIKFTYNKSFYYKIDISTFDFLQENGIDITSDINKIGETYCFQDNIDGIIFCLNLGVDINYLLKTISCSDNLTTIKFLIDNGADVNCLTFDDIMYSSDFYVLEFLINCGLDISNNLNNLMIYAIGENYIDLVMYYMGYGIDIHFNDELFLIIAIKSGNIDIVNIDIVKLLLDHGANWEY